MFSETEDLTSALDLDILDEFFNFNESSNQLECTPTWKHTPMVRWTAEDVLDFIKTEIIFGFLESCNLERFRCISGNIFINLQEEYCQILADSKPLGTIIFEAKENYIRRNPFKEEDYCIAVNKEYPRESDVYDIFEEKSSKRVGRPKSECRRKRKERSEKLWEFLLHLLHDKKTELIKWENYEEGTFKFVKSDTVARLWGSRNHNKTMNYEKFTRAMRYHYKNKVLLPVPGKRLVYKFGPHAKGWQSSFSFS
ncbi:ETS-related transcription factor Elf-3 [Anoplophora glabripennis]|uniref:ETS-related transcription factor Elf-3 n=1 Tax=Anoplophora glabripennis TaxID=217634 RepID=UPI00087529B8|nr:ETS-related transcription factor Elf-3 [Anoplophora glabripennis]